MEKITKFVHIRGLGFPNQRKLVLPKATGLAFNTIVKKGTNHSQPTRQPDKQADKPAGKQTNVHLCCARDVQKTFIGRTKVP